MCAACCRARGGNPSRGAKSTTTIACHFNLAALEKILHAADGGAEYEVRFQQSGDRYIVRPEHGKLVVERLT